VKQRDKSVIQRVLLAIALSSFAAPLAAHEMSMPAPIDQPGSPVQLKSCYLGTNFMFGDPKLESEQTKMQLSADLARPVPIRYRMLGLRFEFGLDAGKRSSDVVVFTGSEASNNHDSRFVKRARLTFSVLTVRAMLNRVVCF
jgi:hypothetical protein